MQVNVIPNEWKLCKIADVLTIRHGRSQHGIELSNGKYPILATGGEIGRTNTPLYSKPSVLIGRKGTIDKPQYMDTPFWTVDTLFYSEIKESVLPKYIYYLFRTINWKVYNEGSTLPSLSAATIMNIKIKVPPLEEQKKIAEILGTWDRAIEELTGLIAEKKELKRGLMQRLLTGTQRLPGFTKPWKRVKLGEVADLYQPVTISAQELSETGFPVYGANGLIGYYEKYNHDTWQIMITCRGSTCGTVNRTHGKSWITGNAMVVNCDNHNVCKLFLYYNLLNRKFNSVISGSGQPQIVRGPLLKYPLCLPADLAEQKAIADVLSKADSEIDLLNQQLNVLREQKRGLMQKLLTGEICVKVDNE